MPEAHDESGEYLSIGEVLALLLEEFPDVTISKIRFLESQGLIAPERTSSGYRKFYEADIELLRVILHEQRDNYLPLRVIKNRLETGEIDPTGEQSRPQGIPRPDDVDEVDDSGPDADEEVPQRSIASHPSGHRPVPGGSARDAPIPTSATTTSAAATTASTASSDVPVGDGAAAEPAPETSTTAAAPPSSDETAMADDPGAPGATTHLLPGVVLERAEVCAHVGIEDRELRALEDYGVVTPRSSAGVDVYDEHTVATIEIARDLMRAGVDARHLRSWRTAVEREAGLYEQLIAPRLRQRNPESRAAAMEHLRHLDRLGSRLRDVMMRTTLAHHFDT